MLNKLNLVLAIIMSLIIMQPNSFASEPGESYHGFKLIEKRFVKEVNAECLYFEHIKSGARLLKIAADDPNKTFSISFKTVPESDCGTPHIMEHSVLNGSKNFPVKSPFDVLLKGSLNTFLNAMTGGDYTMYPVASMNHKDYFNLMHVYLDAVFNPRIYDDPRILQQEGWHYELTENDEEIVYKGVVYNEMKGAFSSPTRELDYQIHKTLFPDNGYGYTSGGYPSEIPKLTYDDFLDFHRRYYHPVNSYILVYGDADLDKELAFINDNYLNNYKVEDVKAHIPVQKPFKAMQIVQKPYAVAAGSDTGNQTYLTLNYVAGRNTDHVLVMGLEILAEVLINHESGPIRLALQKAGIGKDVSAGVENYKQNVLQIWVQNANTNETEKFKEIVTNTLQNCVETGLDKKMIEGVLNRKEFRLREGDDAQKGLTYNRRVLYGWFYADDPFLGLEYEKTLSAIKVKIAEDYLESLIDSYLINNPHAVLMVMEPKPGLEQEINKNTNAELTAYKASLSGEQVDQLVRDTKKLVAYQEREDTPEAIATIPLLDLKDIETRADWYIAEKQEVAGVDFLYHEEFTNNVVYLDLYFDARVLPQELIPYGALLSEMLANLNTKNYTFGELDNELNLHTGGFNTDLSAFLIERDDNQLAPQFVVTTKAVNRKTDKMYQLTAEILNNTLFDDTERLQEVLNRHQSRLEASVKRNGYSFTLTRATSYFSNTGMYNELKGGLDYYWFITGLSNQFNSRVDEIKTNLKKTATLLFQQGNLVAGVTAANEDLTKARDGFRTFLGSLPAGKSAAQTWKFEPVNKNEGILTASKVQYVIQAYDINKLGYKYDGKMLVLSQILRRDWLQQQLRVIGGAYGAFASIASSGRIYFGSYRDPNLTETFQNYENTRDYLQKFSADETEMKRFIIGTVARLDRPLTPSARGKLAFQRYIEKATQQELQAERDAVLATKEEDIKAMRKLVSDFLEKSVYCVYGDEQKIEANKEIFSRLLSLSPSKEKPQI